ncbi:MAG TPA: Ku protein [Kofleriaceae bacterium]|nr:Ku protein [Kofleriaceae bacterium]
MPARAIDTARISFGLVTIPVKIYSTNMPSQEIHFHLVHEGCGSRLKQQYMCPKHGPVDRSEMVKGYELTKGRVIELTKEELTAVEAAASDDIGLTEFVPIAAVDPLYVDASYYVAPDKGGERAYRLFRDALEHAGIAGIATYAVRGKAYIVMLRPFEDGLVMHSLRYPDEVKPWSEVPLHKLPVPPRSELALAGQIIDSLRHETFDPDQYTDEVKGRVRKLIAQKAKGKEIVVPEPAPTTPVTDLMEALKASLSGKAAGGGKAAHAANGHRASAKPSGRRAHSRPAGRRTARQRPHAARARTSGARRARADR